MDKQTKGELFQNSMAGLQFSLNRLLIESEEHRIMWKIITRSGSFLLGVRSRNISNKSLRSPSGKTVGK